MEQQNQDVRDSIVEFEVETKPIFLACTALAIMKRYIQRKKNQNMNQ